jgi:hypothetical protein
MNKSIFYRAALGNWMTVILPILLSGTMAFVMKLSSFADPESIFFYIGIGLMFIGWCLLVRAKWDQVRRGDIFSFGISRSRPEMKRLYRFSYVVMIAGWLLACFSGAIHTP